MFSGIVEATGRVIKLAVHQKQYRLEIECPLEMKTSDSLCVNGICLTVTDRTKSKITFDILEETFLKTTLKKAKPGDILNLESALKAGDPIGGHFVTGHVDGIGKIKEIRKKNRQKTFVIEYPKDLSSFVACKGSISIDGVSLTVGETPRNCFEVHLIPFTLEHTNLGLRKIKDWVNLEVDILARYTVCALSKKESKITKSFLKEHGFL